MLYECRVVFIYFDCQKVSSLNLRNGGLRNKCDFLNYIKRRCLDVLIMCIRRITEIFCIFAETSAVCVDIEYRYRLYQMITSLALSGVAQMVALVCNWY